MLWLLLYFLYSECIGTFNEIAECRWWHRATRAAYCFQALEWDWYWAWDTDYPVAFVNLVVWLNRYRWTRHSSAGGRSDSAGLVVVSRAVSFVYPYGATLNVAKPAVALLSTGSCAFPLARPICALYQGQQVRSGKGWLHSFVCSEQMKTLLYGVGWRGGGIDPISELLLLWGLEDSRLLGLKQRRVSCACHPKRRELRWLRHTRVRFKTVGVWGTNASLVFRSGGSIYCAKLRFSLFV